MKLRDLGLILPALWIAACAPAGTPASDPGPPTPDLATRADSIAARVLAASGGSEAFAALAVLRYDFGVDLGGVRSVRRRHLWNRRSDDYRIEYDPSPDTTVVVLFNTRSRAGRAYENGRPIPGDSVVVTRAYGSFINDMFWLMAPIKMLDPGVNREWVADSSDAQTDVLHLTFGQVGLTPGDQYWIWVDRSTDMVRRWAYVLEGSPDAPPRSWDWQEYVSLSTPAGPVRLSGRKQGGDVAILTDALEAPAGITDDWFTDPRPRLR